MSTESKEKPILARHVAETLIVPPEQGDTHANTRETIDPEAPTSVEFTNDTDHEEIRVQQGDLRGLSLGEYVIEGQLGSGGMGVIYRARHRRMDREVALKILPLHVSSSPDMVRRFEMEVVAAARLIHPNIVTAYDASQDKGLHYLVMEYVEGIDLARLLDQRGPLPVAEAVSHIIQAAEGLGYAHAKGVVHRDIKPSNLLLASDGTIKILDMGLARLESDAARRAKRSSAGPQALGVAGTVDYMAPEQARQFDSTDQRADIYSLGTTLYHLVTGKVPFPGESLIDKLIENADVVLPKHDRLPSSIHAVLAKMTKRNRTQRYENVVEVIDALRQAMETSGSQATESAARPTTSPHAPTPQPSRAPSRADKRAIADGLRAISISELPLCDTLEFPLEDLGGRRLLEAGYPISPRLLRELNGQKVETVWVRESDCVKLLGPHYAESFNTCLAPETLDSASIATQRLDREIQRTRVSEIIHGGQAFRDRCRSHGAAPYEKSVVADCERVFEESLAQLNRIMGNVHCAEDQRKGVLAQATTIIKNLMRMLTVDVDVAISIASRPAEEKYLLRHSLSMATLGMAMAADLGYDESNVVLIGLSGLFHDIGMREIPAKLTQLPRRLRQQEYQDVMRHIQHTADVLHLFQLPRSVRLACYQVHERGDGSGYPRGKTLGEIHPYARILAVADSYLALISSRPFRRAMLPYSVVEYLLRQTNEGVFDQISVRSFLQVVSLMPLGSWVVLSDDRAGRVIRTNPESWDAPVLEIHFGAEGHELTTPEIVDLKESRVRVVMPIRSPSNFHSL
ncbi:Serine/threonine-protein kinase PrkC [Planctomycetes bacterium Pan216]|uniref:Serine/threonine-protein kinase PrkC n=1 Tax=Kolteria novifilia TaxID=2527975 RepID=A0A518B1L6_9BACT|nr:Serine/threonine-protein kinase PrkC [Planctomycetes bacterium Pan216]